MRYAVIETGRVANLVEAEAALAAERGWVEAPADTHIGDVWDGEQFTRLVDVVAAKARAWEAIKAKRDALSDNGGYLVSGKWFHSDAKSKTQQLALARKADKVQAAAGDMGAQFAGNAGFWKTMDGSFVPMTASLAQAIADAAELQDGAIFAAAETHRAAMQASADPAAYNFSGGWPATFQG